MNDAVWREGYTRYEGLRAFLGTLSYMMVGSVWIAQHIAASRPGAGWRLLDIGCGEGTFTSHLLRRLESRGLMPARIQAVDPDTDNLTAYEQSLASMYSGELVVQEGRAETLDQSILTADVIVVSHALYGFLELPTTTAADVKDLFDHLTSLVRAGGVLLWSLASETSAAYAVKREVLRALSVPDRSVFGERVAGALGSAGIHHRNEILASYMDVTGLFEKNPDQVVDWTSYFCRVPVDRLGEFGLKRLLGIIEKHARYARDPDDNAQPWPAREAAVESSDMYSTRILPHAEFMGRIDPS